MGTGPQVALSPRRMLWGGRIAGAIPFPMLLFNGIMKLVKPAAVVEELGRLGYPESLVLGIGILELASKRRWPSGRSAVAARLDDRVSVALHLMRRKRR